MECFVLLVVCAIAIFLIALVASSAKQQSPSGSSRPAARPRPTPGRATDRGPARAAAPTWSVAHDEPPSPEQAALESRRCWVPPGQSATVAGLDLPGGMLYVGQKLRSLGRWRVPQEPALIDPTLSAHHQEARSDDQADLGYWPTYRTISPLHRGGYLRWLAAGRSDPAAAIGYVFLFFYGLERRLLIDANQLETARREMPAILAEIDRLLEIYGHHGSFGTYARQLREAAALLHRGVKLSQLEPPGQRVGWEVPLTLRLALGAFVEQGEVIPAEWALSWLLNDPESSLRTPAQRCPEEFAELFELRYRQKFRGGGMKLRPNKTRLKAEYRPASPGFDHALPLTVPDLPDVTVLSAPRRKLRALADGVCDELASYSRWVGRKGEADLAALALLPPEVGRETEDSRALVARLEEVLGDTDWTTVEVAELVRPWPRKSPDKIAKKEAEMLAAFLARRGLGVEPDSRFGTRKLSTAKRAVLFRLGETTVAEPGSAFRAAQLLLELAAAVSVADGEVDREEERLLLEHLERALQLNEAEERRLRAHAHWLLEERPSVTGVRKRLESLPEDRRRKIAHFLLRVAAADGRISVEEVRLLARVYPWLGLAADDVYSDLHALAAPGGDGPVTVQEGEASPGFAVPAGPPAEPGEALQLDARRVAAMLEETAAVAEMLGDIFEDEDEEPEPVVVVAQDDSLGLDAPHREFLRRLGQRDRWQQAEVEALGQELGLLPQGALETVNEAALEAAGAPVLEGEETIHLDREVFEEILP